MLEIAKRAIVTMTDFSQNIMVLNCEGYARAFLHKNQWLTQWLTFLRQISHYGQYPKNSNKIIQCIIISLKRLDFQIGFNLEKYCSGFSGTIFVYCSVNIFSKAKAYSLCVCLIFSVTLFSVNFMNLFFAEPDIPGALQGKRRRKEIRENDFLMNNQSQQ